MKKLIHYVTILSIIVTASNVYAQKDNVGIGTKAPDQSALLDLSSSTKGLLIPRLSESQRNSINAPAKGLLIYQTDNKEGFYFYTGEAWQTLRTGAANEVLAIGDAWVQGGNANVPNAAAGVFGTNVAVPLTINVNNQASGLIEFATGRTHFGYVAGKRNTGFNSIAVGNYALSGINPADGSNIGLGSTGANNVAVGYSALLNNNTGFGNFALGTFSLRANVTGSNNVGIGNEALLVNTANNNLGIGASALTSLSGAAGNDNIGIGSFALSNSISGQQNTAIGSEAGRNNTGSRNLFLGFNVGKSAVGSDLLMLDNSDNNTPLIGGNFSLNKVGINTSMSAIASSPAGVNFMVNGAAVIGNVTATTLTDINTVAGYSLYVANGILTEKVKVSLQAATWADYVFAKDYKMMTLPQVEKFYKAHKHLPNVPSAAELEKTGLDMVKTDAKLMEKIEELTIYMVDLNKQVQSLKAENSKLKKQVSQLKK
jgi:hypothetical protein